MGSTLGKSKSLPISEKVNGQEKPLVNGTNNHHSNGTTTLERKLKKKKEKLFNKKSSDFKVDKCTSTDGSIISTTSSSYIKQLVIGPGSNTMSYDSQLNLVSHLDTPSKDVLELRDACIRRGIISADTHTINLPIPIEPVQEEIVTTTVEEPQNDNATIPTIEEPVKQNEQIESESNN